MFYLVTLTALRGAPRMYLPLSCLISLTFSILGSIILGLALEAGDTNTTLLKAPVLSYAAFGNSAFCPT